MAPLVPRFLPLRMTVTLSGKVRSSVESVEPLSTMMIASGGRVCRRGLERLLDDRLVVEGVVGRGHARGSLSFLPGPDPARHRSWRENARVTGVNSAETHAVGSSAEFFGALRGVSPVRSLMTRGAAGRIAAQELRRTARPFSAAFA